MVDLFYNSRKKARLGQKMKGEEMDSQDNLGDNFQNFLNGTERCRGLRNKWRIGVVAFATTAICCIPNMQASASEEYLPVEAKISTQDFVSGTHFLQNSVSDKVSKEISISEMICEIEKKEKKEKEKKEEKKQKEFLKRATISAMERWAVKSPLEIKLEEEVKKEEVRIGAQRMQLAHVKCEEKKLALMMEAEAAPKDSVALYRVGSVVLNRVRTTYTDFKIVNTVTDVLHQIIGGHRQYDSETIRYAESGRKPSDLSLQIAQGLIDGTIEILPEEILYQTQRMQAWMAHKVKSAELENPDQFYGIPLDFYEKVCQ